MPSVVLRADFQDLARMRLKEAKRLLDFDQFGGAYYLSGLSVECAIKACIAKQTKKYQFPDKHYAIECFEHDPNKLVKLAGLIPALQKKCKSEPQFDVNWGTVKDWNVLSRYDRTINRFKARAIYSAVVSRRHGVMRWLRQNW